MTQTEIIKSSLPDLNSEILKDILKADVRSPLKKQMEIGEKYYKGEHDIKYKKLNEYKIVGDFVNKETDTKEHIEKTIEIPNRSLVKVEHRYHWKLVKQKRDYTLGKPMTISYEPVNDKEITDGQEKIIKKENEKIVGKFWDILGPEFDNFLRQTIINMSNKAYDVWHVFYNEQGEYPVEYAIVKLDELNEKGLLTAKDYEETFDYFDEILNKPEEEPSIEETIAEDTENEQNDAEVDTNNTEQDEAQDNGQAEQDMAQDGTEESEAE